MVLNFRHEIFNQVVSRIKFYAKFEFEIKFEKKKVF
jgi:hypothetical protein